MTKTTNTMMPVAQVADEEPVALATSDSTVGLFERLARDPNTSVEKIERLMGLWERNEGRLAENAFNKAMSEAQAEMEPISADATNPQTHSRYASYAQLDRALRPIYTQHGFGLSFDTGETPLETHVRVCCKVTHIGGFARDYHLDMPADGKGAKGGDVMTKTHATGSALSYGMRYLLKMIFNVAVGEDDDDGNEAGGSPEGPPRPKDYDDKIDDLNAAADEGFAKFELAWKALDGKYRAYAVEMDGARMGRIKQKALDVDKKNGVKR